MRELKIESYDAYYELLKDPGAVRGGTSQFPLRGHHQRNLLFPQRGPVEFFEDHDPRHGRTAEKLSQQDPRPLEPLPAAAARRPIPPRSACGSACPPSPRGRSTSSEQTSARRFSRGPGPGATMTMPCRACPRSGAKSGSTPRMDRTSSSRPSATWSRSVPTTFAIHSPPANSTWSFCATC